MGEHAGRDPRRRAPPGADGLEARLEGVWVCLWTSVGGRLRFVSVVGAPGSGREYGGVVGPGWGEGLEDITRRAAWRFHDDLIRAYGGDDEDG